MPKESDAGSGTKGKIVDALKGVYRDARSKSEIARLIKKARGRVQKSGKRFIFSIIIPVYNAAEYVEETFESLVNQSIGFENTQVILVNDGSKDNSEEVCLRIAAKYPSNVLYLSQENRGVSGARNNGLEHAEGYYLGFLDSDDLYSEDYFYELLKFAEKNPDVEIFTAKTHFFGRNEAEHPLNYICAKTAVVNLDDQFGSTPLSAARSLFKHTAVEGHRFKEGLKYTEDSLFVNEILVNRPIFGTLAKPGYYYRKHESNDSSSDGVAGDPHWYCEVLKTSHSATFDLARKKWGYIPRFVQNIVAYDLMWRVRTKIPASIPEETATEYKELMRTLLQDISDEVLLANASFDLSTRLYALSLKHDVPVEHFGERLVSCGFSLALLGDPELGMDRAIALPNIPNWALVRFDIIDYDKKTESLYLEGCLPKLRVDNAIMKVQFLYNDKTIDAELYNYPHSTMPRAFDSEPMIGHVYFKAVLPVEQGGRLSALVWMNGGTPSKPALAFGAFSHLLGRGTRSYAVLDDRCLLYLDDFKRELGISVEHQTQKMLDKRERVFVNDLRLRGDADEWISLRESALDWRKKNPDKKIWLFTDRVTSAEDSGEVMFRYVVEHPIKDVEPVFIIRDDVPDYERLKQYGKVLAAGSREHFEAVINAEAIISSSGDKWVYNPFDEGQPFLRDLLRFKYVFLQHGVIKESIASWLYKTQKHIDLFVTSAERERQSIVDGEYGYDEDQVILTGLPRWDSFEHAEDETKRVIYLMPTWRQYLSGEYEWNVEDGANVMRAVEGFSETDYCKFFRSVLEDEKLRKLLEEYDYVLKFAPHPRIGPAIGAFKGNDRVQILVPETFFYSDAYREMSLFITDYSSTAFNVAILRKPIIYVQFDKEKFYTEHTGKKDYYDYELDGFGPVFKDKDALVDYIQELLKNDMKMDDMYAKRVEDFFFWPPNGELRAKLVLDEVLNLLERSE